MKLFQITSVLAAVPFLMAEPIPSGASIFKPRQEWCLVNHQQTDLWVEDGLSRWRIHYSSEGANQQENMDRYCDYYKPANCAPQCCQEFFNVQCYLKDGVAPVVDVSTFRGPVGDSGFRTCVGRIMDKWQSETGCETG